MQDSKSSKANTSISGDHEKGFSLLRVDTIQLWSWLEGYQPLDELSLKSLSEDISYRIREITDNAMNHMYHCKRSELKTGDLNKAFQISNIDKTYGYSGNSQIRLRKINADKIPDKSLSQFKTSLFEFRDENLHLKLDECEPSLPKDPKTDDLLHGRWLIIHGNKLNKDMAQITPNLPFDLIKNEANSFDLENDELFLSQMSSDYKLYYDMITSVILGEYDFDGQEEDAIFMTLLDDLKTNAKLQPMLPFLVNFLSKTIQILTVSMSSEKDTVKKKTYLQYLARCIETLRRLILNPDVFLAPKGIYSKILSCLLFCILQNSSHDFFELKELSSQVLVTFLRIYRPYSANSVTYITEKFFLSHLNGNLSDEQSLFTIYGILACFSNLGGQIIHQYYSKLKSCALKFDKSSDNQTQFSIIVSKKLMTCLVLHYIWFSRTQSDLEPNFYPQISSMYKQLVDLYGIYVVHLISNSTTIKNGQRVEPTRRTRYRFVKQSDQPRPKIDRNQVFEVPITTLGKKRITINYGTSRSTENKSKPVLDCGPDNGILCDQFIVLGSIGSFTRK